MWTDRRSKNHSTLIPTRIPIAPLNEPYKIYIPSEGPGSGLPDDIYIIILLLPLPAHHISNYIIGYFNGRTLED
jgi:hypothetical protein